MYARGGAVVSPRGEPSGEVPALAECGLWHLSSCLPWLSAAGLPFTCACAGRGLRPVPCRQNPATPPRSRAAPAGMRPSLRRGPPQACAGLLSSRE